MFGESVSILGLRLPCYNPRNSSHAYSKHETDGDIPGCCTKDETQSDASADTKCGPFLFWRVVFGFGFVRIGLHRFASAVMRVFPG